MLYKAKKYFVSALNEVFLVGTLIDNEFYDKLNPNEQSYFELFNEREEGMDLIGGVCRPALEETNDNHFIPCLPKQNVSCSRNEEIEKIYSILKRLDTGNMDELVSEYKDVVRNAKERSIK